MRYTIEFHYANEVHTTRLETATATYRLACLLGDYVVRILVDGTECDSNEFHLMLAEEWHPNEQSAS